MKELHMVSTDCLYLAVVITTYKQAVWQLIYCLIHGC
jgi:hypothetical protein